MYTELGHLEIGLVKIGTGILDFGIMHAFRS